MNKILDYSIKNHKQKLDKLIETNAPYDSILKESQKLDKLIIIAMRQMNKELV